MNTMIFEYYGKGWFSERSKIYSALAEEFPKKLDQVSFSFTAPKSGWIDMTIKVNGEEKLTAPISTVYDPFKDFSKWMESIVRGDQRVVTIGYDYEGNECFLTYEKLYSAEIGAEVVTDKDGNRTNEWRSFDANSRPEVGVFYVYDSGTDSIPVFAVCKIKELVESFYTSMLWFFVSGKKDFEQEWFYGENEYGKKPKYTKWTLYNWVKSPLLDWNYRTGRTYACDRPSFKRNPKISSVVHMWAEYEDALFWTADGKCCGSSSSLSLDDGSVIDLTGIDGLKSWYEKFDADTHPAYEWTTEEYDAWNREGWKYADAVRAILPPDVDLFVSFGRSSDSVPHIVADSCRMLMKKRATDQ